MLQLINWPLRAADTVAHAFEAAEHRVDPLFLQLQPPERELHAWAGCCHVLHGLTQSTNFDQQGSEYIAFRRPRCLGGQGRAERGDDP